MQPQQLSNRQLRTQRWANGLAVRSQNQNQQQQQQQRRTANYLPPQNQMPYNNNLCTRNWIPRRNQRSAPSNDHQMVIKSEKWFDVVKGANKYTFHPGVSGIPHLDRFASIYENYQLRYFEISYRPSAGTTVPGNITAGVDYNPINERKATDITLLSPNFSGTVYTEHCLRVIVNRAMKGNTWLYTAIANTEDPNSRAFSLYVDAATEQSDIGQIWVTYKIAFTTATSPPGSAIGQSVAICTSSTNVAGTTQISPGDSVNISAEEQPLLTINQPVTTTDITQAATGDITSELTTVINLDKDADVGTTFTAGAIITPSDSDQASMRFRSTAPQITFKYADGTTVPNTTIQPLQAAPRVFFSSPSNQRSDIFATLFKIIKPLAGPVLGYLQDIIDPPLHSFASRWADSEDQTIDQVPDNYTVFAFEGDSSTINIPNSNSKPLAAILSTNLMLYCGVGAGGSIKGFIQPGDANIFSQDDNWVKDISQSGGGQSKQWDITFQAPRSDKSFHLGDLVVIHIALLGPLDAGFSAYRSMQLNTYSPESATSLSDYIVAQSTGKDVNDAVVLRPLLFDFVKNNSSNRGYGAQNGLTLGYRVNSKQELKSLSIVFSAGQLFSSVDPVVSHEIPKPAEFFDYGLCLALCQITIFPTNNDVRPPANTSASICMQRLPRNIQLNNQQQQQKPSKIASSFPDSECDSVYL